MENTQEIDLDVDAIIEGAKVEGRREMEQQLRKAFNELSVACHAAMKDAQDRRRRDEWGIAFGYMEGMRHLAANLLGLQFEDIKDATEL